MAEIMFYERPVILNRERHRDLKLNIVPNHFAFAAHSNALPIASNEFVEAARDYPIVFVGKADEPLNVAALMGLRDSENLLVDTSGRWAEGTYIPAFARRYPFVLAKAPDSDDLVACIDEVYPGLSNDDGESLFDGAGAESPYLQRVLDFLRMFHIEAERTMRFASRLQALGLLEQIVINVDRAGERQHLEGVWIVNAQRYRAIDDARVIELFRQGYVTWIEAHLLSLGSLPHLTARLDARLSATDPRRDPAPATSDSAAPRTGRKRKD